MAAGLPGSGRGSGSQRLSSPAWLFPLVNGQPAGHGLGAPRQLKGSGVQRLFWRGRAEVHNTKHKSCGYCHSLITDHRPSHVPIHNICDAPHPTIAAAEGLQCVHSLLKHQRRAAFGFDLAMNLCISSSLGRSPANNLDSRRSAGQYPGSQVPATTAY